MPDLNEQLNHNDIRHLEQKVDKGFSGTHKRLDVLNGKVAENTTWRHRITGVLIFLSLIVVPVVLYAVKAWIDNNFMQ